MSTTEEYADAVTAATETYLDAVRDCLGLLPEVVAAYGEPGFTDAVDRFAAAESTADDRLDDLRALLGEFAPPNYTDVYLRAGEVVRLFALVDEVPNTAERFVHDLATTDPLLAPPTAVELRKMAERIVDATARLADAVEAYVGDLVSPGDAASVRGAIGGIADLESACDDYRNSAIERAFEAEPTDRALVVRALATTLDEAADAAEDAADHLLFMSSATP